MFSTQKTDMFLHIYFPYLGLFLPCSFKIVDSAFHGFPRGLFMFCVKRSPLFSCEVFVVINLCLTPGRPAVWYSCDQLEPPDVSMDSCTERLTAVWIHKQGD